MEEEKNFKLIPLKRWGKETGEFAKCSPKHFIEIMKYNWSIDYGKGAYVKTSNVNGKKNVSMHYFVIVLLEKINIPEGYVIDHINVRDIKNKLNNTIENLRVITRGQNVNNKRKLENTTSEFYGVSLYASNNTYISGVQFKGNYVSLGYFKSEIDAAMARDAYIVQNNLLDEYFNLNFKDKIEELKLYDIKTNRLMRPEKKFKLSVTTTSRKGYFESKIRKNKKNVFYYKSKNMIECAKKYDEFVVKNGLDKKLNFPEDYPNYEPTKIEKYKIEYIDNNIVKIFVNNKETTVLKESYEKIKFFKLSILPNNRVNIVCNQNTYLFHRFLMDEYNSSIIIDHIDKNPLNNCLNNLRRTDLAGNSENRKKQKTENSTNYLCVLKVGDKFETNINNKTFRYTKRHKTEEYAARDRDLQYLKRIPNSNYEIYFAEDWKKPGEIERWTELLKNEKL